MELSQLLNEFDTNERLKRQTINPLAELYSLQLPDYRTDSIVEAIFKQEQENYERMRQILHPLNGLDFPSLNNHASALYDAFKPMRDSTADATEAVRGIYDLMRPVRGVISRFEEESRLMDVLAPARMLLQETSLNRIVSSTDFINQILAESNILERTRAFHGYGENLFQAISPLQTLNNDWLSAVSRFDRATINFYGPAIAVPSREVEVSFRETRIIIGDDFDEESVERPDLPELEELIALVSTTLLPSYRGALQRMNDIDDDYQRQAVTSLRTFLQKLMEMLAPDHVVEAYLLATQGKTLDGTPSWILRIEAAYHSLNQPALTNTLKSRAKIMALNIEILQKTVHELPELHSHDQLQHYFNNALGSVRNILEVFHLTRLSR